MTAADNHHNVSFKVSECAEETAGKKAKPHERDACDKKKSDLAPKENKTDVATYPVGSKVAGELRYKLSEHHDNNTGGISVSREATRDNGRKKTAPLLLVIAHGTNNALLSMEDTKIGGIINLHGIIKHTTETTSEDSHKVDNSRDAMSSCHPNLTGVYKSGSTGENFNGTLNNSTLHTI